MSNKKIEVVILSSTSTSVLVSPLDWNAVYELREQDLEPTTRINIAYVNYNTLVNSNRIC